MTNLPGWTTRELLTELDRFNTFRQYENHRHAQAMAEINEKMNAIEAELARRRTADQGAENSAKAE